VDTDSLIDALSRRAQPVRPLPRPSVRAVLWLAPGLAIVAGVVVAVKGPFDPRMVTGDARLAIEQAAMLATAIGAAVAAFQSTVPGASRRWLWVPAATLALWLASVGRGCVDDYLRLGAEGLALGFDSGCVVPAVLIGVVPGVAMVAMLRKGAPLTPRLTLAFAGLAVAALANFGLTLFHIGDVSIMVLVWHFGLIVALSATASWLGPRLLAWRGAAEPAV